MSKPTYIDHLEEDDRLLFPHAKDFSNPKDSDYQTWVCLSFLSPEGIKNCSVRGLKIRGVFGTSEEANARAKQLQDADPNFHVFVGEIGKWLPWDPDPNSVQDQEYQEKELNDLMKGYKENLEKSKLMQKQRKDDMIKKAAIEEQQKLSSSGRANKTKERLRKKLAAMKEKEKKEKEKELEQQSQQSKELTNKEKEFEKLDTVLKEEEKLASAERERLNALNKNITDKKQNLETIDSKLDKIKELYEKLNSDQ